MYSLGAYVTGEVSGSLWTTRTIARAAGADFNGPFAESRNDAAGNGRVFTSSRRRPPAGGDSPRRSITKNEGAYSVSSSAKKINDPLPGHNAFKPSSRLCTAVSWALLSASQQRAYNGSDSGGKALTAFARADTKPY